MKIYKDWNNMTEEEKRTEKLAISIMSVVFILLIVLFTLAIT